MNVSGQAPINTINTLSTSQTPADTRSYNWIPYDNGNVVVTAVRTPTNVSGYRHDMQLEANIQAYSGWRSEEGQASLLNMLDGDKQLIGVHGETDSRYQETASAKGDLTESEARSLVEQVAVTKLDPGTSMDYLQAGKNSGQIKLEYGVSAFQANMMYGSTDQLYTNESQQPRFVTNEFKAGVNLVTNSGNQISLNISFKEELDTSSSGGWSKGVMESFAEFHKRVDIAAAKLKIGGAKSESDYRSISISYESSSPLTKEESKYINQLSSRILKTADHAGNGKMALSGYDLESNFNGLSELFASVEIDASYSGYAQGDADYELTILSSGIESNLDVEEVWAGDEIRSVQVQRFF